MDLDDLVGAALRRPSRTSGRHGSRRTAEEVAEFRGAPRAAPDDLLGYLEHRVTTREDAADLLAETMLRAGRRCDRLPGP